MATYVEIDDPADPRLADYRDLRDVQLRQSLEAEHGLFLAEGEKVVRRAAEAGYPVRSFLMAPRWLDGLADVLDGTDAPCYVVSEALAEQVTGFHVHRGALASLARTPLPVGRGGARGRPHGRGLRGHRRPHQRRGDLPHAPPRWAWTRVLLAPRCADPLYRRSVKVAMGAVFSLPWTRLPDWYDALPHAPPGAGSPRSRSPSPTGAVPLEEAVAGLDKVALVLGSEGHGLSARWESTGADGRGDPDAPRGRLAQRRRRRRRSPATRRRGARDYGPSGSAGSP